MATVRPCDRPPTSKTSTASYAVDATTPAHPGVSREIEDELLNLEQSLACLAVGRTGVDRTGESRLKQSLGNLYLVLCREVSESVIPSSQPANNKMGLPPWCLFICRRLAGNAMERTNPFIPAKAKSLFLLRKYVGSSHHCLLCCVSQEGDCPR